MLKVECTLQPERTTVHSALVSSPFLCVWAPPESVHNVDMENNNNDRVHANSPLFRCASL